MVCTPVLEPLTLHLNVYNHELENRNGNLKSQPISIILQLLSISAVNSVTKHSHSLPADLSYSELGPPVSFNSPK